MNRIPAFLIIFFLFFTHFKSSLSTARRELRQELWLVVNEDYSGTFRFERVPFRAWIYHCHLIHYKPLIAVAILVL